MSYEWPFELNYYNTPCIGRVFFGKLHISSFPLPLKSLQEQWGIVSFVLAPSGQILQNLAGVKVYCQPLDGPKITHENREGVNTEGHVYFNLTQYVNLLNPDKSNRIKLM